MIVELVENLRRKMFDGGFTQKALAQAAGLNDTAVRDILVGRSRSPRYGTLQRLSQTLGCTIADLIGVSSPPGIGSPLEQGNMDVTESPSLRPIDANATSNFINIPEVEFQKPEGDVVVTKDSMPKGTWPLPRFYLESYLGIKSPADLVVIEVVGDSMEPALRPGDRVLVNTGDRLPSPPGIFVLWDGIGIVLKRLENIHGATPATFRIMSENPQHRTYELSADTADVIGRVVWMARRI